jgi:hypothetical protein
VGGTVVGRPDPSFILLPVPDPYGTTLGHTRIMVYGPDLAASSSITGLIDAGDTYWCNDGQAYNGFDYGVDGGYSSNSYVYLHTIVDPTSSTVSGTLHSPLASYALIGDSLPGAAPGYAFNQPARLADISGTWILNLPGGGTTALTIASDGTFTMDFGTWKLEGQLTPSALGINLFDYRGPYPSSGIGMSYPLANGQQQLVLVWYADNGFGYDPHVAIGRR